MRRRKKVLVLSQHYKPEPNFITTDVAEVLARHADVVVVTAHPNYPHGKFYSGVRWWWPQRSVENGVTVWRVPMIPDRSVSPVRRMIAYFSFAVVAALVAPFVAGRPDVVWVYQGPFTAILASAWFRLFTHARIVLTSADLWPESFVAADMVKPGAIIRLCYAYRRTSHRLAHQIIGTTKNTIQRYVAEGYPADRTLFVPVWVDGIQPVDPHSTPSRSVANIVYAGNLGPAQQLETVIDAAAQLQKEGVPIRFDLYGTGPAEAGLRARAAELGLSNLQFYGRVPAETAFERSASAFAQIVSLRPGPMFRGTIPSKLFLCMAAGSPLLCGVEGETAHIVQESGGGILWDAADPSTLVAAVKQLLATSPEHQAVMRQRLIGYYREHFDRDKLLEQYVNVLLSGGDSRRA